MTTPFTVTTTSNNHTIFFRPNAFSELKGSEVSGDFKLINLYQKFKDKIIILNRNQDMALIQTKDSAIPSATATREEIHEYRSLLQIKGCIINVMTGKIMAYPLECHQIIFPNTTETFHDLFDRSTMMHYQEGCVLRMFYTGERWLISTSSRIDASNSNIPGTTLKVMNVFKECVPDFNVKLLNTNMVHYFMVVHPNNQILNSNQVNPSVVYMAAKDVNNGRIQDLDNDIVSLPGMKKPSYVDSPTTNQMFSQNKWLMTISDGLWIQVGNPNMVQLIEARRINESIFHPPLYMYFRLPLAQRFLLRHASAYIYKDDLDEANINKWISKQVNDMAEFCTMLTICRSERFNLICKKIVEEFLIKHPIPKDTDRNIIENHFISRLQILAENDGLGFYRLAEACITFIKRLDAIDIIIADSSENKLNLFGYGDFTGKVFMQRPGTQSKPFLNTIKPQVPVPGPQKKKKSRSKQKKPVKGMADLVAAVDNLGI